jgi:transposase
VTDESLLHSSHDELVELVLRAYRDLEQAQSDQAQRDARIQELEEQLRWFKKQLFGRKSERRIVDSSSSQLCLGEVLGESSRPAPEETVRSYSRRKPKTEGLEAEPDESGLRFDDSVPVRTIEVPNPELEGLSQDEIEEVGEKITYRLAQQPGSYVVLKIVRKTVKRRDTQSLSCPPAPPSVLEKSYADVSLLAGMLVDKLRYHRVPRRHAQLLRVRRSEAMLHG